MLEIKNLKADINKKQITLHMKVEKILKGISDKRRTNNKKYINICNNLDNHENRTTPDYSLKNRGHLLSLKLNIE